jgi:hypothetical protein
MVRPEPFEAKIMTDIFGFDDCPGFVSLMVFTSASKFACDWKVVYVAQRYPEMTVSVVDRLQRLTPGWLMSVAKGVNQAVGSTPRERSPPDRM